MKEIPLTQGKVALVDDEWYERLIRFNWSIDGSGYPQCYTSKGRGRRPTRMHRVILALVGSQAADHINGDRLDNRLCNLRLCNKSQNAANTGPNKKNRTGFKGVSIPTDRIGYRALIKMNGKQVAIGTYKTAEEAARAYDAAAKEAFGEFAYLNFP